MIHEAKLPPMAGYVEAADAEGNHYYRPVNDRVNEAVEAVELILSGDTGEEADDEADA